MKIIDLTMSIDAKTPVFPGDPKQEIKQVATIRDNGWNEKWLLFNSHFGTHIDAPYHMLENAKKLDDFPMEKFIGRLVVIDVLDQKNIKSDLNGVKENDIVFFRTDHTKKAYDKNFFTTNPVIDPYTANAAIQKKVKIIGIDSWTPDNEPYEVHKMLFKKDILIIENLVNLDKVKNGKFMCYVMPLKIKDADGAPCRVIAVQNND